MEGQAGTRSGKLELTMEEDGAVSGTLTSQGFDGGDNSTAVEGRVSGKSLHLKAEFEMEGMQVTTTIDAELDGDTLSGESVSKLEFGEFESKLTGTRDPRAQKEVRR